MHTWTIGSNHQPPRSYPFNTRISYCGQFRAWDLSRIGANSQSNVLFPGCSIRSGEGYDRTFSGQDSEIANDNTEDVGISFSICPGSSFCTRTGWICGPSPSLWPGSQAFTTMECERPVVSGNPVLGLPYFTGSLVQTSSRAMAEQGFSSCYGSAGSSTTRLLSVHGCESGGLGRPSWRSLSFRPLVCSMEQKTHKCSGTPSSLVSSEVLSSGNFRLPGVAVDRQHNCGGLSEQRRGGQVSNLVVHGNQTASVVCEMTGVSDSQICSRQTERTRRFALEEEADHSYRVDSPQGHSLSDFSLLGSPTHRSVCHETKQSTTDLCVSISRPLSLGSGCDIPVLGGNVSVCISSHPPSFEDAIENGERDLFGHSDSSILGKSPVLSTAGVSAGCSSDQTSLSAGSSDPISFSSYSSEIGNIQPARLVVLQGGLEKAGFSERSARECVLLKELPHSLSTITIGTLGWIGVLNGRWIPSIRL